MFEKCYDDFWQFLDLSKLTDDIDSNRIIDQTEVTLNEISKSYFVNGKSRNRIENYSDTLHKVRLLVNEFINST